MKRSLVLLLSILIAFFLFFIPVIASSPLFNDELITTEKVLDLNLPPGTYDGYRLEEDDETITLLVFPDEILSLLSDFKTDKNLIIKFSENSAETADPCTGESFPVINGNNHTIKAKTFSCLLHVSLTGDLGEKQEGRGTINDLNIIAAPPSSSRCIWVNEIRNVHFENPDHVDITINDLNNESFHFNKVVGLVCVDSDCTDSIFNLNATYKVTISISIAILKSENGSVKNTRVKNIELINRENSIIDEYIDYSIYSLLAAMNKAGIGYYGIYPYFIPINRGISDCIYYGIYSFLDPVNSTIDALIYGSNIIGIYTCGSVINCHLCIACGDPLEDQSNQKLGLYATKEAIGILSAGANILSSSVHNVYAPEVVGMQSNSFENVRISNIGNSSSDGYREISCSRVDCLHWDWDHTAFGAPIRHCSNVYLFNIHGNKVLDYNKPQDNNRLYQVDNVYMLDVGNSGSVNYDNPRNISELKLILLRIESNIVMYLNAVGNYYNNPGLLVGYMSDDNLGKMAHGFDYYDKYMINFEYANSDSLVMEYNLSRLAISFNYNDNEGIILPEIIIKFEECELPNTVKKEKFEPPMVCGEMYNIFTESDEGYKIENAEIFSCNRDAYQEGVFSYIDEDYRYGLLFYADEVGVLHVGARFLTPQTNEYILNYYNGLIESINRSAEKYGIGKVSTRFYYLYPETGTVKPLKPLDPSGVISRSGAESETDQIATDPHSVVVVRPICGGFAMYSKEDKPEISGHRTTISIFVKNDNGKIFMITCGHDIYSGYAIYQSGMILDSNGIPIVKQEIDLKKDFISNVLVSFNPCNETVSGTIKTDASITEIDSELYDTNEKKKAMGKIYFNEIKGGKMHIKFVGINGYKTFDQIKKYQKGAEKMYMYGSTSEEIVGTYKDFAYFVPVSSTYFYKCKVSVCIFIEANDLQEGDSGGPVLTKEGFIFKDNMLIGLSVGVFEGVINGRWVKYNVVAPISIAMDALRDEANTGHLTIMTA